MAKSKASEKEIDSFSAYMEQETEHLFAEGVLYNEPSSLPEDGGEAAWIRSQGWTPLEMLVATYKNPFQKMSDRISAAKAVLDFCHRKLPSKIEVTADVKQSSTITADKLSRLTDKELETFTKLLAKLEGPE